MSYIFFISSALSQLYKLYHMSERHRVFLKLNTLCYHVQCYYMSREYHLLKRASVCACVMWSVFFFLLVALRPSHVVSLWICIYLLKDPLQPHLRVASCVYEAEGLLPRGVLDDVHLVTARSPETRKSSISYTPHKSAQVASTEVVVFVVGNYSTWQRLQAQLTTEARDFS